MRLKISFLFFTLLCSACLIGGSASRRRAQIYQPTDLSREQVEGVTISLMAAPTTAVPGDTFRFTASAYNASSQNIQLGIQCGPPLDVTITQPDGTKLSVLVEQFTGAGGRAAFNCGLAEAVHFAFPGEVKTNYLEWRVPTQRGEYVAMAGLRRADGLSNLSAPVHLLVQ
jgi:hypothetical protein